MAKLLVFRGETFLREIELGRQTFRIGRSEQNDLVLEDPGKAVSRNHAEIRYEGGHYVLADLESQNGIWVSGARVPFVVLEPKTAASVGPYRLTLEVDPPTETDFVLPPDELLDAPTEFSSAVKPEPRVTEAIARPTPKPTAERPTPKPSVPKPTPKPAARKPAAANAATQQWLLIGGAAVAVIVIAAVVVMRFRGPSTPQTDPRVVALIADARGLIDRSDCARALSDAINPALALEPNNADALALKDRANGCLPPPPPSVDAAPVAMTADEITEHLRVAEEAITRRECEAALTEHITKVLAQDPTNQQAVDLKVKAEACPPLSVRAPQAPQAAAPKLAVKIPAENGGLEPTSGELDKDYQVRVRAMRARYDDAVGILATGAFARAIPALQSVARDATNRYLDIASKLNEAKKGAATQAMNDARDFESKNDYDQAIQALRRAAAADPDPKIDDDLKRVGEKRTQAGLKACDDGKNAYAFNRPQQALQFYQQVVRLLPADHPCTVTAKERIAVLSR